MLRTPATISRCAEDDPGDELVLVRMPSTVYDKSFTALSRSGINSR
jgi:hypothetical protein